MFVFLIYLFIYTLRPQLPKQPTNKQTMKGEENLSRSLAFCESSVLGEYKINKALFYYIDCGSLSAHGDEALCEPCYEDSIK